MIVVIGRKVYKTIKEELRRYSGTETGGVLLGHSFANVFIILNSTLSGEKSIHEKCSFIMDMEYAESQAERIISETRFVHPKIVGLWHNHTSRNTRFSLDDEDTNKRFSKLNKHGAISILVTEEHSLYEASVHYVNNVGNAEICRKFILTKKTDAVR